MDLTGWLLDDLRLLRQRFDRQVWTVVPSARRGELADGGGASITFLSWHLARHVDVAINAAVREREPLTTSWLDRLGPGTVPAGAGLPEAEDRDLTARIEPTVVAAFLDELLAETGRWLEDEGAAVLKEPVDGLAGLERAGVPAGTFPWLEAMWEGQDAAFHLRWEVLGHGFNHLGEMVSVRNRLGLSPF